MHALCASESIAPSCRRDGSAAVVKSPPRLWRRHPLASTRPICRHRVSLKASAAVRTEAAAAPAAVRRQVLALLGAAAAWRAPAAWGESLGGLAQCGHARRL
jgi:hypothetical protein